MPYDFEILLLAWKLGKGFDKYNMYGNKQQAPIDVKDTQAMIHAKLHPPFLRIDRTLFQKSDYEKKMLKKIRKKGPDTPSITRPKTASLPVFRVTVYTENLKKNNLFKTTHSFKIRQNELFGIFDLLNRNGYKIKNYTLCTA